MANSTLTGSTEAANHSQEGFKSSCPRCGAIRIDKQIGLEDTPRAYCDRLAAVFRGVRRCLTDWGTVWCNIADSYGGSRGNSTPAPNTKWPHAAADTPGEAKRGTEGGSLLGIPWMFAEAMRADGWLLRGEITWVKLSPMPESVAGWRWQRCRVKVTAQPKAVRNKAAFCDDLPLSRDHTGGIDHAEKAVWADCPGCPKCLPYGGYVLRKGAWRPTRATESLFLFAKSPKYYCDGEAVKQPARESTVMRDRTTRVLDDPGEQFAVKHDHETSSGGAANLRNWIVFNGAPQPLRLKDGLSPEQQQAAMAALKQYFVGINDENAQDWQVFRSENLKEAHYAAFPSGIPSLAIRAGTSKKGNCPRCLSPWCRVIEPTEATRKAQESLLGRTADGWADKKECNGYVSEYRTSGWRPSCLCDAGPPVPAVILDPFMGSGTSARAAVKLNRRYVGCDLSGEYVKMALARIRRAEGGKGAGVFS